MRVGDRPWLLRGLVIGLALIVGLVAWLASRGDGESAAAPSEGAVSRVVTAEELADVAADAEYPIYWAGPVPGTELELTEGVDGSTQVRYLEPGEGAVEALTIGSYPLLDPAGALDTFAGRPGSTTRRSPDGREVVTSVEAPTSAYFVSPDNSVQVEVYDPAPKRALRIALSPRVRPLD